MTPEITTPSVDPATTGPGTGAPTNTPAAAVTPSGSVPDGTAPDGTAAGASDDERPLFQKTVLEQMGGVWGMVHSAVPVLVFVIANQAGGLMPAIWSSIAVAMLIMVWRLVRKDPIQPAVSGLLGVAMFAGVAYWMGAARGFFLAGIWYNLVFAGVMLLSILVRRPLVGVLWSAANDTGFAWLRNRAAMLRYDLASGAFFLLFAAKYLAQRFFYDADQVNALGAVKIVGIAAFALPVLVAYWAIRSVKRIMDAETPAPTETPGS